MKKWYVLGFGLGLTLAELAQAQTTDPVDRNKSGGYLGAAFSFGQANRVGKGTGGTAWFLGIEPGYGMSRDTWARFELSFELGTGKLAYKDKDNSSNASVDVDVAYYGLIKAGYGYSLGDNVFAVWRLGVGPSSVKWTAKDSGVKAKSDSLSGLVYQAGVDIVAPMSDRMDLYGGVTYRIMSFNVDDAKVDGVTGSVKIDKDEQVNIPMVQVGARMHF